MKTPSILLAITLIGSTLMAQPNTFSHKTSDGNEIILLSEGQRQGQTNILLGATPEMLRNAVPDGTYPSATNAFLVRTKNGKNVLVDAGHGRELFRNLLEYGVTDGKIDVILITHMHGDHIGGLLNADGEKAFPNAQLYIAKLEHDFYTDNTSSLNERGRQAGMAVINAYHDQLVVFEPENEELIADVIKPMPNYGHTPGHTVYRVDNMLIWGDMTHAMAIQMPYPTVAVTYDTDSNQAVESRLKMLKYIWENNLSVAGMHIAYPGMGTLKPNGSGGYVFTPMK